MAIRILGIPIGRYDGTLILPSLLIPSRIFENLGGTHRVSSYHEEYDNRHDCWYAYCYTRDKDAPDGIIMHVENGFSGRDALEKLKDKIKKGY